MRDYRTPAKVRARVNTRYAVKSGAITPPDACEQCGRQGELDGHHPDYENPLLVEWLCHSCHTKLHQPGEPVRAQSVDWPFGLWQRIRIAADAEKPKISFRAWIIDAAERKLARGGK